MYRNFQRDVTVWTGWQRNHLSQSHPALTRSDGAFVLPVYCLWQDLSLGTVIFDIMTLTLKFDLLEKTLYIVIYN